VSAARGSPPLAAAALTLVAVFLFAAMDTAIRAAGAHIPALLLLTLRYSVQAGAMAVWIASRRGLSFRVAHPRFQALRGALLLSSSVCAFFGLQHLPVPEFTAVSMLTPVLVTLLSAMLLKEVVAPARWVLVAVSLAGALIVLRPGSGLFGWAALFPLAGALAYASFQVLSTRMAHLDPPLTTHFWTGFTGTALVLPVLLALLPSWTGRLAQVPATSWALALFIAACGSFGHLLLVLAYRHASAATFAPLHYAQIAFAVLLSWFAFDRLPDGPAFAGMLLIAASGATSAWLNLRARRPAG
jgi:drug/metabolite transporter (DMT)-like permease